MDQPRIATGTTLSPFRHRLFLAVWAANVVSAFGGQIQQVGASWLMTSLTASPQLVALVATATLLPVLLFSLPFGAVADLFDRRRVLLAAQLIMFAASTLLAAAAWFDFVTPWLLLALTFLLGTGFALNAPAWQASVGELVPREDLAGAISLNILGFNVARMLAPALGGLIVAAAGSRAAFTVNAFTYIALLVVLASWRRPPDRSDVAPESVASAIINGIRYVANARGCERIIARAAVFGICLAAPMALMALVARDTLGGSPEIFGLLLGFGGGGAVLGAMAATPLRNRFRVETVLRFGQLLAAASIALIAASRSVPLTALGQLGVGVGMVLSFTSFNVTMQLSVPRWIVGRAMSIYQMGAFGGLALGAWLWGAVADVASIPAALWIAAAAMLLVALLGLRFPLLQPDPDLLAPGRRMHGHDLEIGEEDLRAPIRITVEYEIEECDREAFLILMRERRSVRRRDGVTNWSLVQDADDRRHWIERFGRGSWNDFLRHRERRSIEEERNLDAILALHRGAERPRVRYFIERNIGGRSFSRSGGGPSILD